MNSEKESWEVSRQKAAIANSKMRQEQARIAPINLSSKTARDIVHMHQRGEDVGDIAIATKCLVTYIRRVLEAHNARKEAV